MTREQLEALFGKKFSSRSKPTLFRAPGRTELGGNHTDHNNGKVLAAAIQLEVLAAAAPFPGSENSVTVFSAGWDDPFVVQLDRWDPVPEEVGKTEALIRGVAAGFRKRGYVVGGFQAVVDSTVQPGLGLSSSAAIEILFGVVFSHLFNEGRVSPEELALIGQEAENRFFGKPCGLMDQMASALGGVVSIDFMNPQKPLVEKLPLDLEGKGWTLMIVDTGGNHADLTSDYASIRAEMASIAQHFGQSVLRGVDENAFFSELPRLKGVVSHRALLRAIHYFEENQRVHAMVEALKREDLAAYLSTVNASGRSSFQYLQNVYSLSHPSDQGISLGLALTEKFLHGEGASRVHGGGFAGAIQAYIPVSRTKDYTAFMERVFGKGAAKELHIRHEVAGLLEN